MKHSQMIQLKDPVRDFSLKDQNDKIFDLFEHAVKRMLLSFHPLAWTQVCTGQMRSLEENWEAFRSSDTILVGISVDSVPCKKAWAGKIGVTHTSLLRYFWPRGKVAQQYGLFRNANGFFRTVKCTG